MRILLVINGTDFGGSEVAAGRIAEQLTKRGHRVHVLSLKPIGPVGRRIAAAGINVSSLGMGPSVNLREALRAVSALARFLRAGDFDLVHSFLPRANVISRVANQLCGRPRPHIASERGTDFLRSHSVMLLNRLTARWSAAIVAVSPAVRDVLVTRDRVPAERILVLPTGVDLQAIDSSQPADIRAELGLGSSVPVICTVGRLVRDKGQAYLIRAFAKLDRKPEAHLWIVGDGDEEHRLRTEAEAFGVASSVHLLGSREDVVGILKSADVFVLPSLQEGLPVVLLEAMACSLPIVASDVADVRALIRSDETGLLVPPAEVWEPHSSGTSFPARNGALPALTAAMAALLGDPERARRLGRSARRLVERFHTVESEISRLEMLYEAAEQGETLGRGLAAAS